MIIYRITNTINGKSYIGQTTEVLEFRWKRHCRSCIDGDNHFMRALRKHGFECWEKEILEEVIDINLLDAREIYWIEHFDTFKNGYNSTTGGQYNKVTKERIKREVRPEVIEKRRQSMIKKMADKYPVDQRKPKPIPFGSEEYRTNMAEKTKALWNKPGHRETVGAKISESLTGQVRKRGYKQSKEWVAKRTEKIKGKPFTESHIEALKKARAGKLWWNNGIERTRSSECPGEGWMRGKKLQVNIHNQE
jgi:group I intron endonuclease